MAFLSILDKKRKFYLKVLQLLSNLPNVFNINIRVLFTTHKYKHHKKNCIEHDSYYQ